MWELNIVNSSFFTVFDHEIFIQHLVYCMSWWDQNCITPWCNLGSLTRCNQGSSRPVFGFLQCCHGCITLLAACPVCLTIFASAIHFCLCRVPSVEPFEYHPSDQLACHLLPFPGIMHYWHCHQREIGRNRWRAWSLLWEGKHKCVQI